MIVIELVPTFLLIAAIVLDLLALLSTLTVLGVIGGPGTEPLPILIPIYGIPGIALTVLLLYYFHVGFTLW